jgi:protein subunit release factor B
LDLCKDKDKIKKERQEAKKLRTKIVGVGNTMDSYGDKFQPASNEKSGSSNGQYEKPDRGDNDNAQRTVNQSGSYDPYNSTKPLSEKIGVILDDVDKVNDGDNAETIKQKLSGNKNKKGFSKQQENERGGLLGFWF